MTQITEALTSIDNALTTLRENRQTLLRVLHSKLLDRSELFFAQKRLTKRLKKTLS